MEISQLINYCDECYSNANTKYRCKDCENDCQGSCELCLEKIHFGDNRRYNCENISNYYVCKYTYKYSSEIEYLMRCTSEFKKLESYKVLSVGCGPCSDLFGINNFVTQNDCAKQIVYVGVDFNNIWKPMHKKIEHIAQSSNVIVKFLYHDIFKIIDKLNVRTKNVWIPNILSLQYVLSDMHKYNSKDEIEDFLNEVINKIIYYMPNDSFIILNDINYDESSRQYFEYFYTEIKSKFQNSRCKRRHFDNSSRSNHFDYGIEYTENTLTSIIPQRIVNNYNPWNFCSSAQMVIQKKE